LGTTLGLWMTYWIVSTMAQDLWGKVQPTAGRPMEVLERLRRLPRATTGMMLAHLGVAVFAFGVSMVRTYETERDVQMNIGDTTEVGGYVFKLKGISEVMGPNFTAARGEVEITQGGDAVTTLYPEKRVYLVQSNPMTEAAIDAGLTRDLYVSMGEQLDTGAWIVRVYHKPFVDWIWGGCLIMSLGGVVAASDRRYRRKVSA
jgi:cytochrome c-type biogenesis protein CcmF